VSFDSFALQFATGEVEVDHAQSGRDLRVQYVGALSGP
jgi:hypothetical protein